MVGLSCLVYYIVRFVSTLLYHNYRAKLCSLRVRSRPPPSFRYGELSGWMCYRFIDRFAVRVVADSLGCQSSSSSSSATSGNVPNVVSKRRVSFGYCMRCGKFFRLDRICLAVNMVPLMPIERCSVSRSFRKVGHRMR